MIKETIDQYLPSDEQLREEIINSPIYKQIINRAETIDNFASQEDFPDVLKMTREVILGHTSKMRNPQIVPINIQIANGYNFPILLISTDGKWVDKDNKKITQPYYMLGIKNHPWFNIETETPKGTYIGSVVNILAINTKKKSDTNHNALIFIGTKLKPYIAYPLVKDFTAVREDYRDDIILKYAEFLDKIEQTYKNKKGVQKSINEGRKPLMGINERSVKIFKKEISRYKILGLSTEYNDNCRYKCKDKNRKTTYITL